MNARELSPRQLLDAALASVRAELGFGLDPGAALLFADAAIVERAAFNSALCGCVPLRQPVAQRIAEPGGLRTQSGQADFLPD